MKSCFVIFIIFILCLLCFYGVNSGVINDDEKTDFIYWAPERYLTFFGDDANTDDVSTQNKDGGGATDLVDNSVVIKASEAADLCSYKEKLYKQGETHVTDCTLCECNNGRMLCSVATCQPQPECIRFEAIEGKCCPDCVEWGCYHEGVGYARGARIPTPPCQVCFCPWEGGTGGGARCSKVTCPPSDCVDGKVPQGKCCPVCLHGPNCWMGDLVIPYGQDVWVAPCRSCACPVRDGSANVGLKAICKWHNNCVFG